jgi:hypothetical protein
VLVQRRCYWKLAGTPNIVLMHYRSPTAGATREVSSPPTAATPLTVQGRLPSDGSYPAHDEPKGHGVGAAGHEEPPVALPHAHAGLSGHAGDAGHNMEAKLEPPTSLGDAGMGLAHGPGHSLPHADTGMPQISQMNGQGNPWDFPSASAAPTTQSAWFPPGHPVRF